MKGRRLFGWAVFAAMAAALACLTPLPHRISAPLVLQPRGARPVYVTAPGSLEQSVREGQVVRRGQVLARLENLDVRREAARLEGLRDLQAMRLENLKRRQVGDPRAGEQIPVAEEAMADIQQRLEKRRADYERLTIVSPADGVILPPPRTPEDESGLRGWAGSPLDPRNQGAFLETGVLLGWVGDPRCFDAVLVIDQADVEFVQVGRPVRIQIDQMPGQLLAGVVSELSRVDLKTAPRELTAAGLLPAREDSDGQRRPVHASYLARVRLDDLDQPLVLGSPGRAKIESSPQSLGSRIHRYLRRTFRFEF